MSAFWLANSRIDLSPAPVFLSLAPHRGRATLSALFLLLQSDKGPPDGGTCHFSESPYA
jgi:hypothetical protein